VGFNPFRDQEKKTTDVVMVVLAIGATLGVIAWAIFST
jgi:hypothetical protein